MFQHRDKSIKPLFETLKVNIDSNIFARKAECKNSNMFLEKIIISAYLEHFCRTGNILVVIEITGKSL